MLYYCSECRVVFFDVLCKTCPQCREGQLLPVNIVQQASQLTPVAADGDTVPPLIAFLLHPENYPSADQGSHPTTSG